MGFQRKPYKLVWPSTSVWHGLEVRIRGMSIDELGKVAKFGGDTAQQGIDKLRPMIAELKAALIDWNYEDEEENPIPIEDFDKQDVALIMAVLHAWQGVLNVPDPLPSASPNGSTPGEASIPMVIPSSSHPN